MANRNNGRRGRSRKRNRPRATAVAASGAAPASSASGGEAAPATASSKAAAPKRARRGDNERTGAQRGFKDPQSLGERPQAPWHPIPLSELLILIGAVATVIGASKLQKDSSAGAPALIAGVVAVLIGTLEFSFREHRSGYRSHTILLALLPTVVVFTGSLLVLSAFISPVPVGLKIAPLALAVPLFAVLYKALRARFADARRERVFAGGR